MTTDSSADAAQLPFPKDGEVEERWRRLAGDADLTWPHATVQGLEFKGPEAHVRPHRGFSIWSSRREPSFSECAKAAASDLEGGAHGVWLEAGLDSGTRMLTAGDLSLALEAVDLAKVAVQLETDDPLALGGFLLAVAAERKVPRETLLGGLGADPFGSLARFGTLNGGFAGGMFELRAVARLTDGCPNLRPVLVSTRAYQEAGASPSDEIAWAMSTAVEYMRALLTEGYPAAEVPSKLRFASAVGSRFFDEIAKLRAMRLVWSKVLSAMGAPVDMQLHAESSLRGRTRRAPHGNLLRGTAEMFAAIVGGADTVACAPFDATLASSDDHARRLARNTPILLAEESHLASVADPAGGSYFLERLTEAYARAAWTSFRQIESEGGMLAALRNGAVARRLDERAAAEAVEVASRRDVFVGASLFADADEAPVDRAPTNWRMIEGELGEMFGRADATSRSHALAQLTTAQEDDSAVRAASSAASAAGMGVDALAIRSATFKGRPTLHAAPLVRGRRAQPWEDLAQQLKAFASRHGQAPGALVLSVGSHRESRASKLFALDLLAVTGFDASTLDFELSEAVPVDEVEAAFANAPKELVVLVAPPDRIDEVAKALAPVLPGARAVAVVGKSSGHVSLVRGEDVLASMSKLMALLGVGGVR